MKQDRRDLPTNKAATSQGRVLLKLIGIDKSFPDHQVLKGIDLTVHAGEFIAVVGRSGGGKSTLLRLIAGLDQPTKGAVEQNGTRLNGLNRSARMMFQNGRFLPWKNVVDNVGIGLHGNWKQRALDVLDAVGLSGFAAAYPRKLSGGQKQRVALARALISHPDLLLLDEPLSALDALTRIDMQDLIEKVWKKQQLTCILVTHDVGEAVRLADRVILIEAGRISEELAIPLPRPRVRTAASFNRLTDRLLNRLLQSPNC
ncbi:MAG: ATP-binding cassette domain-containing protein [Sporolactobacillus sp.]|jgi:sulfonate transport system ATP-binding protein|nr:ATP-binding cassette domain-containing protein [Sporolactobacillus sp.]